MKEICIAILQYNSTEFTIQLLESLIKLEANNLDKYRIILMDNASENPGRENILSKFPFVEFIQYEKNYGFAKAHNLLLPQINENWLLLLNNDCILVNNAIERILTLSKELDADFSTGNLLNKDGTPQINFSITPTPLRWLFIVFTGFNKIITRFRLHSNISRVGYINGALLLIKKTVIDNIGLFDDSLFMYTEDTDLMFRLHKNHYKGFRFRDPKVIHLGGGSAKKKWTQNELENIKKEQLYKCMLKHFPRWQVLLWSMTRTIYEKIQKLL